MRFNPLRLFRRRSDPPTLLAVTPPRTGERTLLAVENLLGSIAVPEPFALELAGDPDGVTLLARREADQVVRGQIATRYPQARIQQVDADDDPLLLREGEQAWSLTLRASGPEHVPLRSFRDDDLLDAGADPLMGLLGALSELREGERVVARLLLRSLGPDWAEAHQRKAHEPAVPQRYDSRELSDIRRHTNNGMAAAVLALGLVPALLGYQWWQAGEWWKTVALGGGIALGLVALGWAWYRIRKARNRVYDPLLIKEKVSRIAFEGEVQVTAILPAGTKRQRARELPGAVAAAYRDYDQAAGARFKGGRVRPAVPKPARMQPSGPGLFGKRSVLGVRELASLWHPPGTQDETPLVARSGAKVLLPTARSVRGGAHVGRGRSWDSPAPRSA